MGLSGPGVDGAAAGGGIPESATQRQLDGSLVARVDRFTPGWEFCVLYFLSKLSFFDTPEKEMHFQKKKKFFDLCRSTIAIAQTELELKRSYSISYL